jgi:hypothetical protein
MGMMCVPLVSCFVPFVFFLSTDVYDCILHSSAV